MAVQPQTPYQEDIANGVTTVFPLEFDCDDQDHLIVLVDDVEPVFGSWSLTGGAVVFGEAPADGNKITIQRNTPFERKRDYQSYDNSFRPPAVNKDFDHIWLKTQELGVADWLLGRKIQKFRDDVNLTALEETLEQAKEIRDNTADSVIEVQSNVEQSQTLLADTAAQANLAQGYASSANSANNAAQQAVIEVSAAESNVYSALSVQQVAVNNSLTAIAGGHKAYQTLAAAQTAQSTLPANTVIEVTNDGANNGTYQWNGTTLTKSAYDPLTQAKGYADEKIASKDFVDQKGVTEVSIAFVSEDNKDLGHINGDGSYFLSGEDESLQDQLKNRPREVGAKAIAYSLDDSNNQSLLSIKEDGSLYLAGDERSVQDQIFASKSDGRIAVINDTKLSVLSKTNADISWLKKHNRISSSGDTTPSASNRIPAVVKIPTGVLIMYSERISPHDGDNQGARLMQRFVTIDSDYNITSISSAQEVTRPSVDTGLTKHPMLCRAVNNNLVLVYDERETTTTNYRQYVRTSSDNGVTWSSAVEITQNTAASGQVCAVGSTGAMIVLASGRIVCPMYTTNSIWMMYSDDNGVTWTHGAIASGTISGDSYSIAEPAITVDKNNGILISVRSQKAGFYKKLLYKSTDNGATTQFYRIADELISAACASSIFYDAENDLMLHSTPSNAGSARTKYRLQYSTNNGANFIGAYRPFSETHYVGYSQIIKFASNTYLVVFEGDEHFQTVNAYENIATIIVNTSEIVNHVNYS